MREPLRFSIDLPLPPAANNAYPTDRRTGRRYLSPQASLWKRDAGWLVKLAKPASITGPYWFTILIPEKDRGDLDGRVKLALDLFVDLGVTPDDAHASAVTARRDAGIPKGRCFISVEAM